MLLHEQVNFWTASLSREGIFFALFDIFVISYSSQLQIFREALSTEDPTEYLEHTYEGR